MNTPEYTQIDDRGGEYTRSVQQAVPSVAILAGNSRVQVGDDGSILVEPQLQAFKAALKLARDIESNRTLPKVSIAFDHQGIFRLQFLANGLTNSQKRNPRLKHLAHCLISAVGRLRAMAPS